MGRTNQRWVKALLISVLIGGLKIGYAGTADLSIDIEFDGIDSGVSFQQGGTFRVTVTNNGPDAAGVGSNSSPISILSGFVGLGEDSTEMSYQLDPNINQSCSFGIIAVEPRPPDPPGFVFFFGTPILQPNTAITCHGLYLINFNQGSRTYNWRVSGYVGDTDPDTSNNSSPVTFGIAPRAVPTIGFLGMLVLIISCVVFGHKRMHRNLQF